MKCIIGSYDNIQFYQRAWSVLCREWTCWYCKVSHAYTGLAHVFQMKGCYQEALHCLHKSKLVLLQCYEDKGKAMPQQVRSGYDILESNMSKVRTIFGNYLDTLPMCALVLSLLFASTVVITCDCGIIPCLLMEYLSRWTGVSSLYAVLMVTQSCSFSWFCAFPDDRTRIGKRWAHPAALRVESSLRNSGF